MAWIDVSTGQRMSRQQYRQRRREVIKTRSWLVALNTETMQIGMTLSAEAKADMEILAAEEGLSVEDYLYKRFVEEPAAKALQRCGYAA